MKQPLVFLLLLIGLLTCKPSQVALDDYEGRQLILANGGGFTGQIIEYILLENGAVFRKNSMDNSIERITTLERADTKQIFHNYELMQLAEMRLDEPGNMYFYIKRIEEGKVNQVKWNAESTGASIDQVKLFYQTVLQKIKK